jgi:hypothetical protein
VEELTEVRVEELTEVRVEELTEGTGGHRVGLTTEAQRHREHRGHRGRALVGVAERNPLC